MKPIKLMDALSYNPLHCIDCNLERTPESLDLSESLAQSIAFWRDVHNAIDHLWLDSNEYEAWAKEQLEDINSPVNRRGLVLCKDLNAICRCYYWYFQDQSSDEFEPMTHCPNCHEPFTLYANGIFRQFTCEQCGIITVAE